MQNIVGASDYILKMYSTVVNQWSHTSLIAKARSNHINTGPITVDEVSKAIGNLKNCKAAGIDNIQADW